MNPSYKSSTALLSFDDFFKQFSSRNFKKKTTILNAGTTPQEIYYLKKGFARSYSISTDGQELTMVIFQPGDFFPLLSAYKPQRLEYYVESLTDVEIIVVPWERFVNFFTNRQDLLSEVNLHLTARFEGVLKRMEYLVFGDASQKLASIIIILSQRFGIKKDSNIIIQAPLTHKDLASLVGLTRETTTLVLNEFIKKGLIEIHSKHIYIKNHAKLKGKSLIDGEE